MMNILNGGKHATHSTDMQEFMIVPHASSFTEKLRIGTEVFHALREILSKQKLSTLSGDEGGFAPTLRSNEAALSLLSEAIAAAGYSPGSDVSIAIDAAASSFFKNSSYDLAAEGKHVSEEELISLYEQWATHFPLVSIEDGLAEEAWGGFQKLTAKLGKKLMIVGDDLFVTNRTFLKRGIAETSANAILVKLNQIGTVSETIAVVDMARKAGFASIISHRSGETEDTSIAHLAVGLGSGWIKTGAPCRGERTAKYNELLRIEESFTL
jgi:enolase